MNKKCLILIVSIILIITWLFILVPKAESHLEEKREQKRLDWILEQINNLYIQNEEYVNKWNELEKEQQEIHGSAELNRWQIKELWNEYYKTNDTWNVMRVICEKAPSSPMCNNYEMLENLKNIAWARWVDYKLLLGIMYAESHIGSNFSSENCRQTNNWWWVKARKYDDGTLSEKFDIQYQSLDKDLSWCWLYYFESVNEFFESLANTISIGYSKCNEDVYCIMKSYVWHESGAWVRNVYLFKSL